MVKRHVINRKPHCICENHAEKSFVIWYGTIPHVAIMESNLIKEILNNKSGDFPKPEINSFTEMFVTGLASYNGDKWAKHRKLANPAFHIGKLKHMLPAFVVCNEELIEKWKKLVNFMGSCEVDVDIPFPKGTGAALFTISDEHQFPIVKVSANQSKQENEAHPQRSWILIDRYNRNKRKAIRSGDHKDDLLGLLLKSNLKE
ncbi:hypothetical protein CRYUN_Cryun10bG0063400 [Craigia yunnanensis]